LILSPFIRGLLLAGALFFLLSVDQASAIELKISIIPKSIKEHLITVNGLSKETINDEAIFDVQDGYVTVEIGKKKIRKFINRPSILQIYYTVEQ
jgi:hypothetical protein